MAGFGKGKGNLSANVSTRRKAYVTLRGRQNDWSTSKMAGAVLDWWLEQGAPPVNDRDHGAQKVPWNEAIKWEVIVDKDELPTAGKLPRDQPHVSLRG